MKFTKEVDRKEIVIVEANPNHFSIFIREGYKEVKEKPKLDKK